MFKRLGYFLKGNMDTKKMVIRGALPQKLSASIFYKINHGRKLDFKNPTTLDEKLLVQKLKYDKDDMATLLSDKYAIREYLEKKGYGQLLNELLLEGVYERAEDIDFDKLPERFAMKCTHGSGYNIIVKDKKQLDVKKAIKQLNVWLREDYGVMMAEAHYSRIKPRIIIEKYMEDKNGGFPSDYKFFASRGEVIGCMIATGRDTKLERLFVDNDFNDLHFIHEYTGENHMTLKPDTYDEMIKIASELSKDFPFVRVDLYDFDGRVVFGELTFTPNSCVHPHFNDEGQRWIGERIKL